MKSIYKENTSNFFPLSFVINGKPSYPRNWNRIVGNRKFNKSRTNSIKTYNNIFLNEDK